MGRRRYGKPDFKGSVHEMRISGTNGDGKLFGYVTDLSSDRRQVILDGSYSRDVQPGYRVRITITEGGWPAKGKVAQNLGWSIKPGERKTVNVTGRNMKDYRHGLSDPCAAECGGFDGVHTEIRNLRYDKLNHNFDHPEVEVKVLKYDLTSECNIITATPWDRYLVWDPAGEVFIGTWSGDQIKYPDFPDPTANSLRQYFHGIPEGTNSFFFQSNAKKKYLIINGIAHDLTGYDFCKALERFKGETRGQFPLIVARALGRNQLKRACGDMALHFEELPRKNEFDVKEYFEENRGFTWG